MSINLQCMYSVSQKRLPFEVKRYSGVASSISEGDIFIYLCSAQITSFKIDLISKEINCAEQEYMNMSRSLIELATPLKRYCLIFEFECFLNDPVMHKTL